MVGTKQGRTTMDEIDFLEFERKLIREIDYMRSMRDKTDDDRGYLGGLQYALSLFKKVNRND